MSTQIVPKGFLSSNQPDLFFEDNAVGRMKKEVWEASDEEINAILAEYGVPSPVEWGKPGSYIQTTTRWKVEENRKKNDIVFIPVGCTELHGQHLPSASDTLYVSQICEGVRRFTEKRGTPVNLALPPLNYGGHPYHHMGMPGTVIVREHVVREMMIDVMLGLWNDGFRKQLIVNNHGQLWMLESAVQEFMKRYQLPGIFRVIDWHRGVRSCMRMNRKHRWACCCTPKWWIWTTPWTPRAKITCPMVTSTSRLIRSDARAAGRKARGISPSKLRPHLKAWSVRPNPARRRKPNARWLPS